MATKYRINWRTVAGTEGHGQPVYDALEKAQRIADADNARFNDIVHHWVEPVEVVEDEQCLAD